MSLQYLRKVITLFHTKSNCYVKQLSFILIVFCFTNISFANYSYTNSDYNYSSSKKGYTFKGIRVSEGDLIAAESYTESDYLFTLFPGRYSTFTHAGVLIAEGQSIYVIEAAGIYTMFANGSNPIDSVRGGIRKTPLEQFVKKYDAVSFFSSNRPLDIDDVKHFTLSAYQNKVPYDSYFDQKDSSTFYCTEFVAKALESGGSPKITASNSVTNTSIRRLIQWSGIKSDRFITVSDLLRHHSWLGTYSYKYTQKQMLVERALKFEIMRRFNQSQKLGDIFHWKLTGVYFRGEIARFFRDVRTANLNHSDINALLGSVRSIADKLFGVAKVVNSVQSNACEVQLEYCSGKF